MPITAELLSIGNEILLGEVLDTNSNWLCQRLTSKGVRVQRVTQLPDDVRLVATAFRETINRAPALLLTTGGLGPTEDDLTLEALAMELNVPLELHPEAVLLVRKAYQRFASLGYVNSAELTPSREKMARLPKGCEPLPNPVGAAPGVRAKVGNTMIICLPGVPGEMKAIFQHSVEPLLLSTFQPGTQRTWYVQVSCNDESVLAPILSLVARDHPQVYIKSRAREFGTTKKFVVMLSSSAPNADAVFRQLDEAYRELAQKLDTRGIRVSRISPES